MKNKMRLFSIAALAMAVMTLASCQKDEMISGNGTVDLFGWVGASSTMTGAAQYGITTSESTSSTDGYGNAVDEAMKSDWGTLAISYAGAIHYGGAYIQTSTAIARNRGCSVRLVRPVE